MTQPRIRKPHNVGTPQLDDLLSALEDEFEVPTKFTADQLRAAEEAVANLKLPEHDDTDLPFFTIDPPGATDLDQAMYLERTESGYLVHYAIADVPGFVRLGSELDELSRQRGQTYYLPHRKITLYPPLISEDRGSLLPDQTRSAYHWSIQLDAAGALGDVSLNRSLIRSRRQLDYASAQQALDSGAGDEQLELLAEIGKLRVDQERLRGGASLNLPDQEIEETESGYQLVNRVPLPLEDFNAQISLLTGIAAARYMMAGGVGILRTMPPPEQEDQDAFRRQTELLGHPWPKEQSYGEYLDTLDVTKPRQLVIMHRAAALFRGADYQVINGQSEEELVQAALAAPYAHTTAPLRRLIDRFVLQLCLVLSAGRPVPEDLATALEELPGLMRSSNTAANRADRAAVDLVEAYTLQHRIGEQFEAIVLSAAAAPQANGKAKRGQLQLVDEPVTGSFNGAGDPGTIVRVRLVRADPAEREIHFETVTHKA